MKTLRTSSVLIIIAASLFAVGSAPAATTLTNAALTAFLCLLGILIFTAAALMIFGASGSGRGLFRGSFRDRINDWANLIQFVGALSFIGSCVQSLIAALKHSPAVAPGWQLNFAGSALFMISSSLALLTFWKLPARSIQDSLTRWSSYVYLFGSILFMGGSVFAVFATMCNSSSLAQAYGYLTAAGAVCFGIGAYLALRAASGAEPKLRHISLREL